MNASSSEAAPVLPMRSRADPVASTRPLSIAIMWSNSAASSM